MSDRPSADPIEAWRDLSARAARASAVRPVATVPAAARRPVAAAGLGLVSLSVVVVAVALVARSVAPGPVATASDTASAAPSGSASSVPTPVATPAAATADDGTYRLTLETPQSRYGPKDTIKPVATIELLGPAASATMFHASSPILFTIEEIDGNRGMGGAMDLPCLHTEIVQGTPVPYPFVKSGVPDQTFDAVWYTDPTLTLPVGRWRIVATMAVDDRECGGAPHRLRVANEIIVDAAAVAPDEPAEPSIERPDPPTSASTSDALFDIRLTTPRSRYTTLDAIEPTVLIRYVGPDDSVTIGGSDPFLVFSIEEIGGDRQMTGGANDSCTLTTFERETATFVPFAKAGQVGLGFDEGWFRDPVLRLPEGTWRISARFEGGIPACEVGSDIHELQTDVVISVVPRG